MKKNLFLIMILLSITTVVFAQEAVSVAGSNTSISTIGQQTNQYDVLITPSLFGNIEGETLFFALDNGDNQFGSFEGFRGIRAGWAVSDSLGFLIDYTTSSFIEGLTVGGEETPDDATDDYQNITLDYDTYDQSSGTYATITETVNDDVKDTTHDHDLLFHSIFGIDDSMAAAVQVLFSLHTHDTLNLDYENTYSNTAAPSDATLTSKGNRTETVNTLLDENENDIALDLEFGMDTSDLIVDAALGVELNNLRLNNSYVETETIYSGGIDATVRDQEIITENTGQYYYGSSVNSSFYMNSGDPDILSTIRVGLGTETEIPLGDLDLIIPFDVGYDFPFGDLSAVETTTTISYNDADADNIETGRTVETTTRTLDKGLDLYSRIGGGIRKVFEPAGNASVTVQPTLTASLSLENDTRTKTDSEAIQSDLNGDGDYLDEGTDIDTIYTESGYEIKNNNLTSVISFIIPLSAEWKANDLMTFRAGYSMGFNVTLESISTLTTGNSSSYIYEQFTDNLTSANSYDIRQKDTTSKESTPSSSFSADFDWTGYGRFGASLEISDNFIIDLLATGSQVEIDAFTVMGIMTY